jgi:hypothetical protein
MVWRCAGPCRQLMYNRDSTGRPVAGDPPSKFLSIHYPKVCFCCFQLYITVEESPYWKKLAEEVKENTRRRKNGESDDGYFPRV